MGGLCFEGPDPNLMFLKAPVYAREEFGVVLLGLLDLAEAFDGRGQVSGDGVNLRRDCREPRVHVPFDGTEFRVRLSPHSGELLVKELIELFEQIVCHWRDYLTSKTRPVKTAFSEPIARAYRRTPMS